MGKIEEGGNILTGNVMNFREQNDYKNIPKRRMDERNENG